MSAQSAGGEGLVACARMYNLTPAIAAAWSELFQHMSAASGVPLRVIDHPPPASLDALWRRTDLGCTFMCGWPFAMAGPQPLTVAAPVPRPPRYGGEAVYHSDLVVRRDSPYQCLEDTFGGRIGWTVENSHSGFNAARHHLLAFRRPERPSLYRESIGPLVTPRAAIRAVLDDVVDVAAIDGYALDLLRRHAPEETAELRVMATTAPAPVPPLVASPGEANAAARLKEAFLTVHEELAAESLLDTLLLERFTGVNAAHYQLQIDWAADALEACYPKPA